MVRHYLAYGPYGCPQSSPSWIKNHVQLVESGDGTFHRLAETAPSDQHRFKLGFTDEELELIEAALRHYAARADDHNRHHDALRLAEKVADADEEEHETN